MFMLHAQPVPVEICPSGWILARARGALVAAAVVAGRMLCDCDVPRYSVVHCREKLSRIYDSESFCDSLDIFVRMINHF